MIAFCAVHAAASGAAYCQSSGGWLDEAGAGGICGTTGVEGTGVEAGVVFATGGAAGRGMSRFATVFTISILRLFIN